MEQFIYWINRLVVWSMICQEMVKNVDQCFPKAQDDIKRFVLYLQLKDIRFKFIKE